MKKLQQNKMLRFFLALCLMVQVIMPGMVWKSEAAGLAGTGTGEIVYNMSKNIDSFSAHFGVYLLLEGTKPYTVNDDHRDNLVSALGLNPSDYSTTDQNAELDAAILAGLTKLSPDPDGTGTASDRQAFADKLETLFSYGDEDEKINGVSITSLTDSLTLSNIPYGYYLIIDESGERDQSTYTTLGYPAVLITVDGTNDAITPKGDLPSFDKKIFHNEDGYAPVIPDPFVEPTTGWGNVGDNEMGDEVYFRVTATLPSAITSFTNDSEPYFFVLDDVMDMTEFSYYDGVNVKMTVDYADGATASSVYNSVADITAVTGLNFVEKDPSFVNEEGWTLTVQLDSTSANLIGADITIEYYATLLNTAKYGKTANENTVNLYYSNYVSGGNWDGTIANSSGDNVEKDHVVVYDYTFSLDLTKVNDSSVVLENATFNLEYNSTPLYFYCATASDTDLVEGYYYLVEPGYSGAETDLVTDTDGKIILIGLDDEKEYTLVETEAPTGYYTNDKELSFTISTTYDDTGATLETFTAICNSEKDSSNTSTTQATPVAVGESASVSVQQLGTLDATIVNVPDSVVLPETGGVGTMMFYVVGGGVLLLAGYLFFVQRKNDKIVNNKK